MIIRAGWEFLLMSSLPKIVVWNPVWERRRY